MQWVFGYGSLMYEPELPEAVEVRRVGWLDGWRRRFNKRSTTRGCGEADARAPAGLPGWVRGDLRLSMVLGTEADPRSSMSGLLLGYPDHHAERLLEGLLTREGPGYAHHDVVVRTADGEVRAWTWLTDPDSELVVHLPVEEVAAVLHAATPRVRRRRALGADYLFGVEHFLEQLGHPDPHITDLAQQVRRLSGP